MLLLKDQALVKSVRFKNHKYIGDPINAVRIFNELKAPVIGIMSVRESHGFAAVTGLAKLCCEDSDQHARKSIIDIGDATASTKSAVTPRVFVHLAMCDAATHQHVNPPLGWVLSEDTRGRFKDLLHMCGNGNELATLGQALGVSFDIPKAMASHSYAQPSAP